MASAKENETEELDEFMQAFVKGMESGHDDLIEAMVRLKLKDPRFPLDINHCVSLAASRGEPAILAKLISLKPHVSFGDSNERRAIHYAAKNGHLECVRLLLKAGSIINCSDKFGKTPLLLACEMGHTEIVSLLVQQCAHINSCRNETGENAIHITASAGHISVMKLLIENSGDINITTRPNKGGETPLHKAVIADKPDMVEFLCQQGAKMDIPDAHGKYPIHVACEKGLIRCVSMLVLYGSPLEVMDSDAQTPLSSASFENQTSVVRLLIDEGANVNTADKQGYTPLHKASFRDNVELINSLVAAGADINARTRLTQHTPLMSAVSAGRLESIQLLISLNADVTLPDYKGHTPLHMAHMKLGGGSIDDISRVLLKGGCRLDVRDHGNLTPIQRGLIAGVLRKSSMFPWLQLLCQAGSALGPDQFTMGKHSPLFWLSYSGLLKEALYLVRAGWDLSEETWIVLPGKDDRQDRFHEFMIQTFKTVPSLLAICRKALRSHLSAIRQYQEILSTVDSLPVPGPVKSFLKLQDIDAEDVSVLDQADTLQHQSDTSTDS